MILTISNSIKEEIGRAFYKFRTDRKVMNNRSKKVKSA